MDYKEKLELYNKAKEAYYNGQEIMTDLEFDNLERELGLENKSKIGTSKNPNYTVKHPTIMGSLSKVQIHKSNDCTIDWKKYYDEAKAYFKNNPVIVTPKYDGCSFEIHIIDGNIESISSRGDGTYGRDLRHHFENTIIKNCINPIWKYTVGEYTLRGEVLVKKEIFEKKYSADFSNPRSFVSGVLNSDYSDDKEFQDMLNDLSIVIYDYRILEDEGWTDYDWTGIENIGSLPEYFINNINIDTPEDFKSIYKKFETYRKECPYALDGIVIKPIASKRKKSKDKRPKDCVAIKFIPMLEETEVINITWNLGKTHEFTPIIWVKPVEMDGRMVQKCSGHNIGYLREKGITIGAKIIMSLAGDIIPFMYKVTQPNDNGEIPMPTDYEWYEDDIHLMGVLSEEDKAFYKYINSAKALNIPFIGVQTAKDIFNYITKDVDEEVMEFFGETTNINPIGEEYPYNILMTNPDDLVFALGGKIGKKAEKSFKDVVKNITLVDIIKSCNFRLCGPKVAEQVANYLLNEEYDWSHLASEGYAWALNKESKEYYELTNVIEHLGKTIEDFKIQHIESKEIASTQIPVILTGDPNNYSSKAEFLKYHPEYRMTGSWKEVQIVFTNSLDSNTGKMKKAREKNIRIELY